LRAQQSTHPHTYHHCRTRTWRKRRKARERGRKSGESATSTSWRMFGILHNKVVQTYLTSGCALTHSHSHTHIHTHAHITIPTHTHRQIEPPFFADINFQFGFHFTLFPFVFFLLFFFILSALANDLIKIPKKKQNERNTEHFLTLFISSLIWDSVSGCASGHAKFINWIFIAKLLARTRASILITYNMPEPSEINGTRSRIGWILLPSSDDDGINLASGILDFIQWFHDQLGQIASAAMGIFGISDL